MPRRLTIKKNHKKKNNLLLLFFKVILKNVLKTFLSEPEAVLELKIINSYIFAVLIQMLSFLVHRINISTC